MNAAESMLSSFHWLRPFWLLAIIPAVLIGIALWRQRRNAHQWQQVIAPELLPYLVDGETTRTRRGQVWLIILSWIIASVALAGPTWEKRPTPIQKNENALVIIFDLSPSMLTEDIKPSRLVRARLKIADVLRERKDGLTALIAYAGDSHVVTPLTDDTATINSLLTSLHPDIMPVPGSNIEAAVTHALALLKDAGVARGDLLLVTDGVVKDAHSAIEAQLKNNFRLSILGVGTDTPAPIPGANGGFLRDNNRAIVTTQLKSAELKTLARNSGGRYSDLTSNNRDIDYLLSMPSPFEEQHRKVEREFDNWYDTGHWLIFLLLPIILYCFRRGVLVALMLVPCLSLYSQESAAFSWEDLWLTKDQQGERILKQGDAATAAEQFQTPEWKGSAQYRAGDYAAAADSFAQSDSAQAHYNRGNALAKAGKLPEAVDAYNEALKRDPAHTDAQTNRQLVEELQKQQEQQQDQQNKDDQKQDKQENSEQQEKQNQQGDGEQQDQEQQSSDESDNEQQNRQDQQQNSSEENSADDQESEKEESQKDESKEEQSDAEKSAEEKQAQQDEKEQAEKEAAQQSSAAGEQEAENAQAIPESNLTDEEKQSLEQWLRRVPDDPGGLLRNKFRYQYQQERDQRHRGAWPTPDQDEQRW